MWQQQLRSVISTINLLDNLHKHSCIPCESITSPWKISILKVLFTVMVFLVSFSDAHSVFSVCWSTYTQSKFSVAEQIFFKMPTRCWRFVDLELFAPYEMNRLIFDNFMVRLSFFQILDFLLTFFSSLFVVSSLLFLPPSWTQTHPPPQPHTHIR